MRFTASENFRRSACGDFIGACGLLFIKEIQHDFMFVKLAAGKLIDDERLLCLWEKADITIYRLPVCPLCACDFAVIGGIAPSLAVLDAVLAAPDFNIDFHKKTLNSVSILWIEFRGFRQLKRLLFPFQTALLLFSRISRISTISGGYSSAETCARSKTAV
ncbi:hypothetical protein LVJ83_08990 [Uruburuella testudinis]|uniref:Uncharacterized protein n=1 Tax=Uruburuella testudinis TaxID=1282863 RepID=A0ABY4DPY2_9NEIS|nr:hypothetical protein [Uruburuella testudinis]UOO81110.1 hypothetical protein LVJ83_08990 [Uruburuella testudinis]